MRRIMSMGRWHYIKLFHTHHNILLYQHESVTLLANAITLFIQIQLFSICATFALVFENIKLLVIYSMLVVSREGKKGRDWSCWDWLVLKRNYHHVPKSRPTAQHMSSNEPERYQLHQLSPVLDIFTLRIHLSSAFEHFIRDQMHWPFLHIPSSFPTSIVKVQFIKAFVIGTCLHLTSCSRSIFHQVPSYPCLKIFWKSSTKNWTPQSRKHKWLEELFSPPHASSRQCLYLCC